MAEIVEQNLKSKESQLTDLLEDTEVIDRLFSEKPTEDDIRRITALPFYIFGYDSRGLVFWNSNELLADCNGRYTGTKLEKNDRGSFIKRCVPVKGADSSRKLTVLFAVVHKFAFENNYLRSHFEAEPNIPLSTEVSSRKQAGSYEVKDATGKPILYLSFPDSKPVWVPGKILLCILAGALLSTIVWLQLVTIYLTRKRNRWVGFFITVGAIILIRGLTYKLGFPFNIGELPIFSPQLYASSAFLPSLGDLLLNALCFLWIVVFFIRHVKFDFLRAVTLAMPFRILLALIVTVLLIWYCGEYVRIIRSLVQDSMISFDVTYFYTITSDTLIGLLTISVITGVSCLVVYVLNVQLSILIKDKWIKYLLVISAGMLGLLWTQPQVPEVYFFFLLGFLLLFIVLLDIEKLTNITDLFAPQTILWSILVCAFGTALLLYFYNNKEHITRQRYAEQVLQQRDDVTEFAFKSISQSVQQDWLVKDFLTHASSEKRRSLNERFDAIYLGGQLNKYQSRVLIFNARGDGLYNSDTTSYSGLRRELAEGEQTSDSTLYYKEYAQDGRYYLAGIPVYDDSSKVLLGSVFIDLSIKESGGETVYPELLQPGSVKNKQQEANYSYAVYVNNKLQTQSGDYPFPVFLSSSPIVQKNNLMRLDGLSELRHSDGSKTVIVVRFYRFWLDAITLFSYLFGIQVLIVISIVVYRLGLFYFTRASSSVKLINFTFRKRIHFSMLGIVLVSFLLIGAATIVFFIFSYKDSNQKKLQRTMQVVERSLLIYLRQEGGLENDTVFNSVTNTPRFKYFITAVANAQKIDINIFNASGILNVASQANIYDKLLVARIIKPEAYYWLKDRNQQVLTRNESIGRLSYLSSYLPIRDEHGKALGYLNVPFFSSEKELNFQISNILVVLINLYAFIFVVSSLVTVFLTRWLTRTLSVVISRFERLTLTKNELIYWPYDDEIGTLVNEYNKMVKKVEENAVLLAQSERETAWREMARQVAHEIKNPLTPMKLNIQYLQQAIKSGYGNIQELALKVSESLIEQIDNLTYIASEFSNFAKMPEAKPEDVDLNELLDKAVELYLNENTNVTLKRSEESLTLYADKSQLLRVFTNLLENAVQAIPEDRDGIVTVIVSKDNSYALVAFRDNGAGIPADIVERIFQPYFTTKSSGTGLGLAMTKKIIEFWGGTIWFETEEGEGTTFFIKLPLLNRD
jgi:signal transduction histidine kinase